jgi:pimeloyl-ACP methyl ester carboxylesterase
MQGQGDYVFLLHGWGAEAALFRPIADVVAGQYTVVAFDFPGFGQTAEPAQAWSVSDYTDFTVEFIRSFSCKNVILLGHSFGGRVIIKMANEKNLPFTLDKLILVDSAGILPRRSLLYKARVGAYKTGKVILNMPGVRILFPRTMTAFKEKMGSADYARASEVMRQCLVKTVNEDLSPLLKTISIPTLLIWGENDMATPLADGRMMEQQISNSGLVVLKGAGHYSFLDQPVIFSRVIRSFLNMGES